MASVTLEGVTKKFGDVTALDDLSIDIEDGEFLVLVGPSGSGKSTALRIVAGLEEITSGAVKIGDRRVDDVAAKDRDLAMVFQNYALYPHMNVRKNLSFGLRLRKTPKDEVMRRISDVAEMLDLTPLLDRKPGQLSGGQRQRVALGRAIVREPAVFLMDEPLSNLDAKLRVATRTELVRLHQRLRTTTIYVTHDQVEAMTMGNRIAVLHRGVLQQLGTARELYENPVNSFVAGFIGSPSMNLFTADVISDNGTTALDASGIRFALHGRTAAQVRQHGDRQVVAGFRPEHVEMGPAPGGDVARFRVTVDVIEYLGDDELVHSQVGDKELLALVSSDQRLDLGDQLDLHVAMDKIHVFDADTGQRVDTAPVG